MVCLGLVQCTTCEAVHGGQADYVPDSILGIGDTLVTKLVKNVWPRTSLVVQCGCICSMHVESSQTRDRTYVACVGRWILYYWTTREV